MRENATKMLVTSDALNAAHEALDVEYGSHCPQPSECFVCDTHNSVDLIVEAAAPLIAAAALRDAADLLGDLHDPDVKLAPVAIILAHLRARADEMEAGHG